MTYQNAKKILELLIEIQVIPENNEHEHNVIIDNLMTLEIKEK